MSTNALAPWFGSNRTLAHHVGAALAGCEWVGVGFAGGMSELKHITARTVVVNDLHRHVINLAYTVGQNGAELAAYLDALPFHPDTLARAQERCQLIEGGERVGPEHTFEWAAAYFVCAWMARNGTAGTDREFKTGLSVRWDAGGGDSAARFRNATESLRDWQEVMKRCTFTILDVFAFLCRVKDDPRHGLYLDPPFPDAGDAYRHKFTEAHQHQLAERLTRFDRCRVVVRFYDHPLIRALYPEPFWSWHHLTGGKRQTNTAAPEVLLIRNPPADPAPLARPYGHPDRFANL